MISKKRQDALMTMYQALLTNNFNQEICDKFEKVFNYVRLNKDDLIELINDNLNNWTFDRLGYISQSILLLACGEVIILKTPKTVIINECVELAKKFGEDDDTYKLINGTLDKLLDI